MAIKLADTLAPMADFPAVMAEHTAFEDGETLQEKYKTGQLGGGGGGYTQLSQAEYDALSDDEKMNGKEYRTYDTGHIYKLGVEYGKDAYFTSLEQLGLTAPTTVGEVFVAMPNKSMLMLNVEAIVDDGTNTLTVTDVPKEYGVLTIEKHIYGRFRIEYSNSLGGAVFNARKWIGALKGSDGTGLVWKEVNTGNHKYTTMAELGLDGATATVQDVMDKVAVGNSVMIRTDAFNDNNWKTQCNGIQWGYLKIEKTQNGLSNIELQEVVAPNRRYFGTQSSGKFVGWVSNTDAKGIAYNSQYYKIDITKGSASWNGVVKFSFNNGTIPTEIAFMITSSEVFYTVTEGANCIKSVTYTINSANVVIGVELNGVVYGTQLLEVNEHFCTINDLTGEQFTGDKVAKFNGYDKTTYNSIAELNKAKGTSITIVNGEDNTQKIVDALSVGEQFVSLYHNNANQNRFGIDTGYGSLINEIRIVKCLDADLTSNYAIATAFMNTGVTMSRIYYKTYSTDWCVNGTITELSQLGLTASATIQNVMDAMTVGQHCILNTSRFDDKTEVDNIEYGKVEIRRLSSGMWSLWLEDVLHGSTVAHGTCSNGKFAGWHYFTTKSYVDNAVSNSGNTFNGKEVKSITIDLSASAFQVKGTSLYKIALDNYISANTNVIKVEGYYVPPTDANSTYKDKRYIVHTSDSDRAGGIRYYDGSWTTCVCQSESGSKKGSGYAKIYYIN